MVNLSQSFHEHSDIIKKALEAGKKFGMTISGADDVNILAVCLLHFWGVISSEESTITKEEMDFFSNVLGDTVSQEALLGLAENESLKMPIFHVLHFYDIYVNLFERHIGIPPTVDFFRFFEMMGSEYLNRFKTTKRIDKYNQYMQSLLSGILAVDKNKKLVLSFTPYKTKNTLPDVKENDKEEGSTTKIIDSNRYLNDSRDNFRNSITSLRQSYLQSLELLEIVASVINKIIPGKFDISPMDLLQTSLLFFLGQLSIVKETTDEDEITFLMGVLGIPLNRAVIESCTSKNILRTYMFEALCAFDNAAKKMSEKPLQSSAAKVLYDFFKVSGEMYLQFFSFPLGRIKAYDLYMKDIADLINREDQALASPIVITPYTSPAVEIYESIRDKLAANIMQEAESADANRCTITEKGTNESQGSKNNHSSPIEELNSLIGLKSIKQDVTELIGLAKAMKMREERGLPTIPISLHLVFTGNPGTGKTTVARILGQLYKEIGVLKKGQIVEVDRSDLVAGYVGQTAIKTQEKIAEAKGGILFIDEAYTLVKEGNDFGQEAIDTLLKEMEDHRGEFVVIVAGYSEQMRSFIDSNPGLKSRFNKYFDFPDYSDVELIQIFDVMCKKYHYHVVNEAKTIVEEKIREMERNKGKNFSNARDIRNYFERIITKQANRVATMNEANDDDLTIITLEDVE